MNQGALRRTRLRDIAVLRSSSVGLRCLLVVVWFALAFAADVLADRHYSAGWGSAAILASVVTLFPSSRTTLAALGTYAATWVIFNIVRAFAEDVPLAIADARTISDVEAAIFGGGLPSAWLQRRFFDPDSIAGWDIALSIVHGSFFVAPFLLAGTIWWWRRNLFRRYAVATAICFALSLPGFLLLPSAPPWLSDPDPEWDRRRWRRRKSDG